MLGGLGATNRANSPIFQCPPGCMMCFDFGFLGQSLQQVKEAVATIKKAMVQIGELSANLTPLSLNQMTLCLTRCIVKACMSYTVPCFLSERQRGILFQASLGFSWVTDCLGPAGLIPRRTGYKMGHHPPGQCKPSFGVPGCRDPGDLLKGPATLTF